MKIYMTSSEPPMPPGIIFIINAKTHYGGSETLVGFHPTGLCVGTGGNGRGKIGMNSPAADVGGMSGNLPRCYCCRSFITRTC